MHFDLSLHIDLWNFLLRVRTIKRCRCCNKYSAQNVIEQNWRMFHLIAVNGMEFTRKQTDIDQSKHTKLRLNQRRFADVTDTAMYSVCFFGLFRHTGLICNAYNNKICMRANRLEKLIVQMNAWMKCLVDFVLAGLLLLI